MPSIKRSRKTLLQSFLSAILLASISGCFFTATPPMGPDESLDAVELYLARGSLMGAEFEQFKLFGAQLYYECGEIKGGRQQPKTQNIGELAPARLEDLKLKAYALVKHIQDKKPQFAEPEKALGFAGPGQLFATVVFNKQPVRIKTALDSTTTPTSESAALLERLATTLRRAAQELESDQILCGNAAFYGLGAGTGSFP